MRIAVCIGGVVLATVACAGRSIEPTPGAEDAGTGATSTGGAGFAGAAGGIGQAGDGGVPLTGGAGPTGGTGGEGGSAGNLAGQGGAAGAGGLEPVCECLEDRDCLTGLCDAGRCAPASATCSNGVQDGEETDVDCGGRACPPCGVGQGCVGNADCADGRCSSCLAICTPPSCRNGVLDGDEWAVDCGPSCDPHDGHCILGADECTCIDDRACHPGRCVGGECQPPSCDDGLLDGAESDVDCGGPDCPPCTAGQRCRAVSDCDEGVCGVVIPRSLECGGDVTRCQAPTCEDGVKNADETDTDCGGSCPPCPAWDACRVAADCQSGVCNAEVCQAPRCWDCVQNGEETGLDCGGPDCADCVEKWEWYCCENSDCASNSCLVGVCRDAPSCDNQWLDGEETDVDCGGSACPPCADGAVCVTGSDCRSRVCTGSICQAPSSADGVQNNCETDVDCGGPLAPPCDGGRECRVSSDCTTEACVAGTCQAPTCTDGRCNAIETDVDCGGPVCSPCPSGGACLVGTDCAGGVCTSGICQPDTCSNGVLDGAETGTDCGGVCPSCAPGQPCARHADCASRVCAGGLCQAPTCTDSEWNGDETDVDCGGSCPGCDQCARCSTGRDCASGFCQAGTCR